MDLRGLVQMSNKYGSDPAFVLAGGGNTSVKEGDILFVKGSGTSLATIKEEGFVAMDRKKLSAMMTVGYPTEEAAREAAALKDMMAARLPSEEGKRPSVEVLLHNLFEQKYVLHVHPALVGGLVCGNDGEKIAQELFGDKALWIGLCRPGYVLSLVCQKTMADAKEKTGVAPQILLLQNHGIFFAADTTEEIDVLAEEVMSKLASRIHRAPDVSPVNVDTTAAAAIAPALRMLYAEGKDAICTFFTNADVAAFIASDEALSPLKGCFTPDHIVYCKAKFLTLEAQGDLAAAFSEFRTANGHAPKIVLIKGLGAFSLGNTKKEADTAKALFLDEVKVAVYTESFGGACHLPQEFVDFIVNWEVENYRQKAMFSGTAKARLHEKVSIVTGSAQGFGAGIAEEMVKQGAYVVIADMNAEGAAACAKRLNEMCPGRAVPCAVNVTDEASVQAMIESTVLAFGGLDIFVNNAGVLRSGGLDTLTLKDFQFVTSVNYTAYFLCVKYACVPMKIQHRYAPDRMMDIVEINSKSGLAGSKKNFAYAGSKFGGVGLTQSFALELVEDNIKVNAICPGNFMDGPLWTDPEKGLFVQYLRAGKVPGAKTIEDVKVFYERKVPMHRGCFPRDVARALFYVVEQQYETGQAVPVTGGQEMLN